jgi:peptidoglycan/LPS O-acetylase OafA/YrhL
MIGRDTLMRQQGVRLDNKRLPSLTGMRFVAALMVFVYHASYEHFFQDQHLGKSFADAFSTTAYIGVSFFFILSGFVLTWSARSEDTPGRFLRRRIAKIFPNHIVTWVVTLLLFAYVGQTISGTPTVLNLLLVHTWVPKLEYFGSVNPVSWSLACEMLFYVSFPVLLRLIKRIRPERLWFAAVVIVAAILVVPLVAKLLPGHPIMPGTTTPVPQFWFVYGLPPVRGLEFVLGMVMARLLTTGRRMPLSLGPAVVLVIAGYLVAQNVSTLYSLVAATVIPLALVIPAAASADLRGRRSPLRVRPMVWLGEISYAFYLVHFLVIHCGHLAFGRATLMGMPVPTHLFETPKAIALIAVLLVVSVLLSWLLYSAVERPVMRRWSRPRTRPPMAREDPDVVPVR